MVIFSLLNVLVSDKLEKLSMKTNEFFGLLVSFLKFQKIEEAKSINKKSAFSLTSREDEKHIRSYLKAISSSASGGANTPEFNLPFIDEDFFRSSCSDDEDEETPRNSEDEESTDIVTLQKWLMLFL